MRSGGAQASPARQAAGPAGRDAPTAAKFTYGFNGNTLGTGWSWVRQDSSAWSLTERHGFLRIHTQAGSLDDNAIANNILTRPALAVDYQVSTHVEFTPTHNFQEASLLLYQNDNNFIKVSRIYNSVVGGSIILLKREVAGAGVGAFFSPVTTATAVDLRLQFVGAHVSGSYRIGTGNWVTLGQYLVGPISAYANVAIAAHHGAPTNPPPSITADFDFVELAELSKLGLPLVLR
jgi:beta-xylosidase